MKFIAVLFGLLLFVGCSSDTPETEPVAIDDVFLSVVHKQAPRSVYVPDESLIELAHAMCDYFDKGGTVEELTVLTVESEMDFDTSAAVFGAGTAAYCPEHSPSNT